MPPLLTDINQLEWHSLSRSYGVNLPSSLMIVSSNAFVFSTCLLVVVSRYGSFLLASSSVLVYCGYLLVSLYFFPEHLALQYIYTLNICIVSSVTIQSLLSPLHYCRGREDVLKETRYLNQHEKIRNQ